MRDGEVSADAADVTSAVGSLRVSSISALQSSSILVPAFDSASWT
jgi:hypothetical protein